MMGLGRTSIIGSLVVRLYIRLIDDGIICPPPLAPRSRDLSNQKWVKGKIHMKYLISI